MGSRCSCASVQHGQNMSNTWLSFPQGIMMVMMEWWPGALELSHVCNLTMTHVAFCGALEFEWFFGGYHGRTAHTWFSWLGTWFISFSMLRTWSCWRWTSKNTRGFGTSKDPWFSPAEIVIWGYTFSDTPSQRNTIGESAPWRPVTGGILRESGRCKDHGWTHGWWVKDHIYKECFVMNPFTINPYMVKSLSTLWRFSDGWFC